MAVEQPQYASAASVTVSLASLTDNAARQSDEINNTTNRYRDALVRAKARGQASGTGRVIVWVFSAVGDTVRAGGAGASDAAFTASNTGELRYLGSIPMDATNDVTVVFPSVASAFGGRMPEKWGLVFQNESGATLDTTAGNFDVDYQGLNPEIA